MELRHLRYFVAVAREGSITRAAAGLGIKQPPLGQQIRALETELEVSLFNRAAKRVSLNANGEVFFKSAVDLLAQVDKMVEQVRSFDKGERGRLTVGLPSSASMHPLAPRILRAFRVAYPLAEIEVLESETYELILALERRRIDAAFLHIDTDGFPELTSHVLTTEGMVVAIPCDHPLARDRNKPVTLSMLSHQPFVVYRRTDGPGLFNKILKAFDAAGVRIEVVDQVNRLIAAVNLVAAGRGITIVPASVRGLHSEAVVYRPLSRRALPALPFYLAHRRDDNLALVANFVRVTTDLAKARDRS
jgi:DNA-binding transcriptional LysR family regulator